ncbi:MAG TPA: hypothetical protein VGX48_16830 [Pyrinomonadaceae bacterium]|jgi:hypothetical protein|nr:hypothetical protein [Pyrinomonadaceae bacterium]
MTSSPQSPRRLRVVGALTACVYLATCLFYARGPEVHTRAGREVFAWFFSLSLLALFYKGYRLVAESRDEGAARAVVFFAAVFCLLTVLTVPFHSTDVFGYINRGWQQVRYGQNPYLYTLAEVPGWEQDPMLREHWLYNPVPYGFLFTLLARGVCAVGGGNWWLTLLLFKLVNASAYALTAWLVWRGARRVGLERPTLALYTFLWNPLILMHHLANGHNDILVGCLLALAFYFATTAACLWIVPVLVAAALLKYAPGLLVPLALLFVWKRRGWKAAAAGLALGAGLAAAVSAPYLKDWRRFRLEDIRDNATLIDNSLHSLLIHVFRNVARLVKPLAQFTGAVDAVIKTTLRAGFLAFFAYRAFLWLRALRRPEGLTARRVMYETTLVLAVLICFVSSKFNGWYMGILLPAALFLEEDHWLRRFVVLVTCAQLLSLTFFKQAYMLNYFAMVLVPAWIVYRQVRSERRQAA